jgi:hypothetical protein
MRRDSWMRSDNTITETYVEPPKFLELSYKATPQEEIEFHPYWSHCPACDMVVSSDMSKTGCETYFDTQGKIVYVPHWQRNRFGQFHSIPGYSDAMMCRLYERMPIPDPPWYIKVLKRLMR